MDGTSATLSSLQGVSSQMLRHQGPSLTPSLGNYVRTDLIAHVMNWPADILEKQVLLLSQLHIGESFCSEKSNGKFGKSRI